MKIKFVCLTTLLAFFAHGSGVLASTTEFGNGGNIIACIGQQHVFFDLYEARNRYEMVPEFPATNSNCDMAEEKFNSVHCNHEVQRIASLLVDRLKSRDPLMAWHLQNLISSFWSEAVLQSSSLWAVADTGTTEFYANCSLKQAVVQYPHSPASNTDRYHLDYHLYLSLDIQSKAALVVHEVLYRYAKETNDSLFSSEGVRYFNGLLLADKISAMSESEYPFAKRILLER